MTPEEYLAFKAKNDEQAAVSRHRAENMRRIRAERKLPRSRELNLERVRAAREVLRRSRHSA